jgi:DNA-binding transcriptional regulator PaaX
MEFKKRTKFDRLGSTQKKILLLLLGGIGLSFAKSPRQYFKVVKGISYEWQKINQQTLKKAIKSLYMSKLISEKENPDGSVTMLLTSSGKTKAITFNLESMTIKKPKYWDGKWRMVAFDIPEKRRNARDALRGMLKRLQFYELQKSIFVYPYECRNEMDYLIEFFRIRPYVRTIIATELDNSIHLKDIFNLS